MEDTDIQDESGFLPIEQVLKGLKIEALAEEDVAVEAIVLIKSVNPKEAKPCWGYRATEGLTYIEALGALEFSKEVLLDDLLTDIEP
jgi:hypothetical protein